jgi:hypothetical protein
MCVCVYNAFVGLDNNSRMKFERAHFAIYSLNYYCEFQNSGPNKFYKKPLTFEF